MSKLDDFLGLVDVTEIRETVKVKAQGKEFEFVVRPITQSEHSEFSKRAQVITKNKVNFDSGKYHDLVISSCIIEPNFNDNDFLTKVKCPTGIEFLHRKFNAGVLSDLAEKIESLSGFNSLEEEVENAKN